MTVRRSWVFVTVLLMSACIEDGKVKDGDPSSEETGAESGGGNTDAPIDDDPVTPGVPVDWDSAGDIDTCNVDVLSAPSVYVRRVKNLMTGGSPADEELSSVTADPAALKGLVAGWFDEPAFRAKLQSFLTKTLQQAEGDRTVFGPQAVDSTNVGRWDSNRELFRNLNESFARTVLVMIDEGRPFNEIATTRSWMMTTGMLSYMLSVENRSPQGLRVYHQPFSVGGVDYDENTPYAVQVANNTYYSPTALEACADPLQGGALNNERNSFRLFHRGDSPGFCDNDVRVVGFQDEDYEDWRMVEMVPLEPGDDQPSMFDPPTLRTLNRLPLRSSRTGYFSTPAFLAAWPSNVDNSFRVTTNQMLIAGLGLAFEDSDVSTPLGDDGLAEDHASPGTQCFACHKNLDPMRNFFTNEYDPDTYAVEIADSEDFIQPSFSFQGHSGFGESLEDLGSILAEHPFFAEGWVQKLCMFANSKECDREDPEFQRVLSVFQDSNLNFETLAVELFSSPLVTGAACVPGEEGGFAEVTLSRQDHLCVTLNTRLGRDNLCDLNNPVRSLVAAIPEDGWARGAARPDQPTEPSLFYTATLNSLCGQIANNVVNRAGSPVQSSDVDGTLAFLVEGLMAVPPSDPLHGELSTILRGHFDTAEAIDGNARNRIRSTFIVACSSALLGSTDL